ncbi:MAG: branched-chain amino acid ABC transporter permease [Candidatus Eisenbacteria bacterium]|nr:branched-chain amino acid ABC transporter permease [Candidatus Eisenbacteria bacterium]
MTSSLGRSSERQEVLKNAILSVVAVAVLIGVGAVLPRMVNPYLFQILILCGINITLAVSLNLINGFTGQFSIGHAGFMAIGGYTSAALTYYLGPHVLAGVAGDGAAATVAGQAFFILSLLAGGAASAVAGFLVGLPSLRLRGDYLAIVTLGFGEIIRVAILNIDAIGGARGFTDIPRYTTFFWVAFFALVTVVFVRNIMSSSHGRAFLSVREDEIAAEALGINTTNYKVMAFVIGAFFAGVAGGLFGHYLMYLHTNSFTFMKSFEVVIMVVLGGMGSITGSVIAAVILTILPEALRPVKEYRMVIYSALLIFLMIARPQGLLGMRELSLSTFRGLKLGGARKSQAGGAKRAL